MHGWKLVDSNGNEYKSWMSAANAARADAQLTFREQAFSMGDHIDRDVTERVHNLMDTRGE